MSVPRVNMPATPAGPTAVNAGDAISQYMQGIANPALQQQIIGAEGTYLPQYQANAQRNLQNQLLGVAPGTEGGYYGTLDLQDMAARRQAQLLQSLGTQQNEYNIAQMGAYGGQANQAYLAANPQLAGILGQAGTMGGRQVSGYLNEAGSAAMAPAMTSNLQAQQIQAPGGSGYMPVSANQIQLGGVMTPERVAAERVAAERVASGQVAAGNVEGGALGSQLYQQALQNQQLSPLSQALQAQGVRMAQQPGQLTPEEMRAATQGSREQFAQAGRLGDNASILGEASARIGASRERQMQDLAASQGINQQLLGAQQAGQQLATQVLQADLARQGQNVGNQLQAGQFNVQSALQAALANQGTGLQAGIANQQTGLQAGLANQQAGMQSQQFNITNAQNVQQANQAANLQAALANQGAYGQNYQFGAGQNMQAQLANQQANYAAAANNQAFNAQQAQQRFSNLLGTTGVEQNMLGADRAYAGQLANMWGGVGNAGLSLIGQSPQAIQYGNQILGMGAQQAGQTGPQLFDPNAGVNLALQNNANLANYNASIYGAQAGAAGAEAQARGQFYGGLFQGIGNIASSFIPKPAPACWVAREVYGVNNPRWLMFREWLFDDSPRWFYRLYLKHGERFARLISGKDKIKAVIRAWMDARIRSKFNL